MLMLFEWDEAKNRANKAKHGVSFETACEVWRDPHCWIYPDRVVDGEQRFHAVGVLSGVTFLLVVHAYRDRNGEDIIRIIGARRATRHEKDAYQNG